MANKNATTIKQKGGNQTELYQGNSPMKKQLKAKSLEMVWPQYVTTGIRYGRPHHIISWNKHFKHGLIKEKQSTFGVKPQKTAEKRQHGF